MQFMASDNFPATTNIAQNGKGIFFNDSVCPPGEQFILIMYHIYPLRATFYLNVCVFSHPPLVGGGSIRGGGELIAIKY